MLSRLYGSPIDVMRVNGRIFVMSGDVEVEKHDHEHKDDGPHGHAHEHGHGHGHAHAHRHGAGAPTLLATDTPTMFEYDFMVNAFAASGIVAVLALAQAWLGVTLAFYTDWPTSFWITALAALVYGASLLGRR